MLLASGIGRMGCHLSGDGDWGIVNTSAKPSWLGFLPDWAWAYSYPHNVARHGKYIVGCAEQYCNILTEPVYPTPLYESVCCLLLFLVLWLVRKRIKTPGMVFFIFLIMLGVERFLVEFIRVNQHYCIGKLCITQAQYISLGFMVTGVAGMTTRLKKFQKVS
jgi:prolipoprotein diacylglyceryltransferase